METPVSLALDALGIPYRLFTHPGQVYSLEQAAQERNQRPEQVVRSILFRLASDQFVMVLAPGQKQISWSALRQHLGVTRMSMASPEEVLERTGYVHGAVSPFGLPSPIRILVDQGILAEEEISIGSGVRNSTVIMRTTDLLSALGDFETGCFVEC